MKINDLRLKKVKSKIKEVIIINTIKSKLSVGTYSYNQLCELLEWCNHTSSKHNQLLELQRHCLYQVVGKTKHQRIHILKIYDEPTTEKQLYYPNGDVYGNHPQVLIPKHLLEVGVKIIYKIQYGTQVYIGSSLNIRSRIKNHFKGYANDMTYSMLKRGATFELLEVVHGTEDDLRQREKEYIKEYVSTGMFIVINDRHNSSKE